MEAVETQIINENKKRRKILPRELRIKIYKRVIELHRQGLSYSKIIEIIEQEFGVRLFKSTIGRWAQGLSNPNNGRYISTSELLEPSEELAYVIGVVLGDGSAINYTIRLRAKDKEFVEEFARCLATVLGRSPIKIIYEKSTECYIAEVHSKTLWELLKKPVDLERLRKYIEHCEKCMAAFLRGFFDSEGHVNERGYVVIDNTDYALLEYVQQLLKKIGIESTGPHLVYTKGKPIPCSKTGKQYRTKKDGYRLYIRACSLLKFYFCVGFTIKRKRRRLEEYLRRTRKI